MADQARNFPEELLEKSLQIKSAARQLMEDHLRPAATYMPHTPLDITARLILEDFMRTGGAPNNANIHRLAADNIKEGASSIIHPHIPKDLSTEDQVRHLAIRLKHPDQRTATEMLFLMTVVHDHATICDYFECEFGQECWRMKGLIYQSARLKAQNRLTPSAMTTLWNRHLEMEMHVGSCKTPRECHCSNLDNYKYLFLKLHSDYRHGRIQPVPKETQPDPSCRAPLGYNHLLVPIFDYFDTKTRKLLYKDILPGSGIELITALMQATYRFKKSEANKYLHSHMEAMAQREKDAREAYEKEKAAKPGRKMMGRLPNGKMVELMPGKNGRFVPIGAPMHEDVARCGPSTSTGVPKRMVEEKKKEVVKKEKEEKPTTFDPSLPGTSTTSREGKMGMKTTCDHNRSCSCVVNERIVDLYLGKKQLITKKEVVKQKELPTNVVAEIAQLVARLADKWEPEGYLPIVRIATLIIGGERITVAYNGEVHNLFRVEHYQAIINQYLFAAQYYPDVSMIIYNFVEERHSEGEKRTRALLGKAGVPLMNLNFKRATARETTMAQFMRNWNALRKGECKEVNALEYPWFSGTFVKMNGKSVEHVWEQFLESDLKYHLDLVDRHGSARPEPEKKPEVKPPIAVKVATPVNNVQRMPLESVDSARKAKALLGGMEAMAQRGTSKEEKDALLSKLKTPEAIDFIKTGKMRTNAKGEPIIPPEFYELLKTYNCPLPYPLKTGGSAGSSSVPSFGYVALEIPEGQSNEWLQAGLAVTGKKGPMTASEKAVREQISKAIKAEDTKLTDEELAILIQQQRAAKARQLQQAGTEDRNDGAKKK